MKKAATHLAIDIGAESGRAVLGWLEDGRMATREIHRFSNRPVQLPDGLRWNILGLFGAVKESLRLAQKECGRLPASMAIDTWGVDYGLVDKAGALVGMPFHYRDARTEGVMAKLLDLAPRERIYQETGTQFVPFNTLVQLLAAKERNPAELDRAETLLCIPDLLAFWLTGVRESEYTISSTTQCMKAGSMEWASDLLDDLGIPKRLLAPITAPGRVRGTTQEGVLAVAAASHDTASAAALVQEEDAAWISSGTWSIMGVEVDRPNTGPDAMNWDITNEGSASGAVRLCRNIMGLWLVQECRRVWAEDGREYSYPELMMLAEEAEPGLAVINPDQEAFLRPGDMPNFIRRACRESDQRVPMSPGEVVRVALESVALRYRWVLGRLEALTGRRLRSLQIVGGGCQNRLLNQLTATLCRRPVACGPVEATAMGSLAVQMLALGSIDSLSDVVPAEDRACIEPGDPSPFQNSIEVFDQMVNS